MPNFFIAVSGLDADSKALNTIASNLSNMNTVAYKSKAASFTDMFYEQLGQNNAGDPLQVGTGTKIATTTTNFTQGEYNTSGMTSNDMAVDGNGFFVVSDGSQNYLTRNGQFTADTSGHLVTTNGDTLMGYAATNGVINSTSLSALTLPTKGQIMSPSASSEFTIQANLNMSAASGSTYTSTVTLIDSLGSEHTATITYSKSTTNNNEWGYSVALPASDFSPAVSTPITGTLNFDGANGNLQSITNAAGTVTTPVATGTSTIPLSFTNLADGASNLSLNWNLLSSTGGQVLTQVNQASATTSAVADGYKSGTYTEFTVDADGSVRASYSNGQKQLIGAVALGDVTNEQGLESLGNGMYQTTKASGNANIGMAGTGALGSVKGSALELSNVDISSEFSQLIIAQRAFEANSKSITTFDSVTQQTINMIR